jgi:nucleotide-binding universal stress UspA family protein
MFKNILIPVDGSALSRKAAQKGVALAKATGAKVTGFHVAPAYKFSVHADYAYAEFVRPDEFEAKSKQVASRHLDVVKKVATAAGVGYAGHFATSDFPADAIVKAATKYKCDAIFMASHGRTGLSKLILGSETNKVLANAKMPVIVWR